ncbi:TIGR01777 family oxidoreductase [Virgibacillus soli]|uniref:TIGR01777 family oxidoreductase n=1 Tax=Paracerasibacillus soli TaxID=480284 RepID=UPI0035E9C076
MNYLVTGGTGFIGKSLVTKLQQKGHHIFILTRTPHEFENTAHTTYIPYDYPAEDLPPIHGVVNLAGESLFGYWTKKKKQTIRTSRIETTEKIIAFMKRLESRPEVFISGSAIGFYGISDENMYTENTKTPGTDFLANVVVQWEETAKKAEELGIRTVLARFGVVLGMDGALSFMQMPIKLFAGGKIGGGDQWMSWVHIEDAVNILIFSLTNKSISGPINVTAPNPLRNKDFMKTVATVLKRPFWFHTPSLIFRAATGEMSQLILHGQYVLPMKAIDHHYTFSFPYLEHALRNILNKQHTK